VGACCVGAMYGFVTSASDGVDVYVYALRTATERTHERSRALSTYFCVDAVTEPDSIQLAYIIITGFALVRTEGL